MVAREKLISAEEFWEIAQRPENAGQHMELIEGVIYTLPLFGMQHGVIAGNFLSFIWDHSYTIS